jgi:hypothetical protein
MSRGDRREEIFRDDLDRKRFLQFKFNLYNFIISNLQFKFRHS